MLPFQRNDILNIRDIEQGLENLQRVPDVDVKINIEPGTRDGYSIVHIDTHRGKNWSVRASYNNWGDEETGRYQTTSVGYLFNPAKMGICFISPVRVVLPDSMKTSVVIIPFRWGTGSTAFSIAKVNRSR